MPASPRDLIGVLALGAILVAGSLPPAFAAQAAVIEINQVAQRFSQASIVVRVMDQVRFLNGDEMQHNIRIIGADGEDDDKGLQRPGVAIDVLFARKGHFMVRCSVHPRMKLAVDVR